ncbi:MAG: chorismate synthase [Lentimicrobium sp.]|jgi:chorismate synthase|nr:chorismate synthase [Lentimicrobium sp.]
MAGNTFGHLLRLTTFGESHGPMIGGVLDGFPSGLPVDIDALMVEMEKRRPGKGDFASPRSEADIPEFVSGMFEGKTTGAPLAFLIRNTHSRSADYEALKNVYRPSHAAYSWEAKYGHYDFRGGGRASARETAVRVVAGALCKQLLSLSGITILGYTAQIGKVKAVVDTFNVEQSAVVNSVLFCPDPVAEKMMLDELATVKSAGDSAGGIVEAVIKGLPAGLGEPVFDKLQADLAKAMLSINAAKGFSYGEGYRVAELYGSQHNDPFEKVGNKVQPSSNHAGGILGGISTGEPVWFSVAFKPVSSIKSTQTTVDKQGNPLELSIKGRHDVTIVPRAVAVVEAMAALVIADHMLLSGRIGHKLP